MPLPPLNITLFLGGPSAEREVSLRSGAQVSAAVRSLGHQVRELDPVKPDWELPKPTDVVFLALHGTYGEDGTVQRRLEELGVPYTGCDPEASRIGFDKFLTKERCVAAGVPTARYTMIDSAAASWPRGWNPPVVLKPVRQGSSVGLQFVERVADWGQALGEALRYDSQVLMEEKIAGREPESTITQTNTLPGPLSIIVPLPLTKPPRRAHNRLRSMRSKPSVGATIHA
jgi:D-alanine-D-alanine ligase